MQYHNPSLRAHMIPEAIRSTEGGFRLLLFYSSRPLRERVRERGQNWAGNAVTLTLALSYQKGEGTREEERALRAGCFRRFRRLQ